MAVIWGTKVVFTVCLGLSVVVGSCRAISVEKEVTLTGQEKVALDELRSRVEPGPRTSDLFLIRWLRANDLNVEAAYRMIMQERAWRAREGIDNILNEDWNDMKQKYYMDESGTDREGRPIVAADISEWDVRMAVLSGEGDRLTRYMIRSIEAASRRVKEQQLAGKNVTQWQVILNMDKFNLGQHACLQCLPIYLRFIEAHETYYPFGADKIMSINTPAAFEVVLNLIRPAMSKSMRDSFMAFGRNKSEWIPVVHDLIDPSELAPHFGGTKEESF